MQELVESVTKFEPQIKTAFKFLGAFAKGFTKRKNEDKQGNKQDNIPKNNTIKPPVGWEEMDKLVRLNHQFNVTDGKESEWWKQGIAWENYKAGNKEATLETFELKPDQNQAKAKIVSEPQTLNELAELYPDSALQQVNSNNHPPTPPTPPVKQDNNDTKTDDITQQKLKEKLKQADEKAGRIKPTEEQKTEKQESEKQEVEKQESQNNKDLKETDDNKEMNIQKNKQQINLEQDIKKYLSMLIMSINQIDDKIFFESLDNPKILIEKFKVYEKLVPAHLIVVIKSNSSEYFKKLFEVNCKEKNDKVIELKKENKIIEFFDEFKKVFDKYDNTGVLKDDI
jgi:hypothetical protein